MPLARLPLPGGREQALDGGDEDEHDEGAHQVGLEDLVPHLGVLQGEQGVGRERGGGRRCEGGAEKDVFRPTERSGRLRHTPRRRHNAMQRFDHKC